MNKIKFAGLFSEWEESFARSYLKKINEIGYIGKVLPLGEYYIVAYSSLDFNKKEAFDYLGNTLKKEK